jgi:hypothetical protein
MWKEARQIAARKCTEGVTDKVLALHVHQFRTKRHTYGEGIPVRTGIGAVRARNHRSPPRSLLDVEAVCGLCSRGIGARRPCRQRCLGVT